MNRMTRQSRGAAAVETTIMMVFLVPTIMYTLFIQDLTWYKIEQQETIVSTPWDYNYVDWNRMKMQEASSSGSSTTTPPDESNEEEGEESEDKSKYDPKKDDEKAPNYDEYPKGVDNVVARNSRRTYCDHTSAYDGTIKHDCQDEHHHTNFAAHQCWLTGKNGGGQKARQVSCVREGESLSVAGLGSGMFNGSFNAGGYIRCDARLGVTNYYVMNDLFLWSKKKVTDMKRFEGGMNEIHGESQSAGAGQSIVFAAQNAALLQDTFALNRPGDVRPADGSPENRFHTRMNSYYSPYVILPAARVAQFLNGLRGDDLLGAPYALANMPFPGVPDTDMTDNITTPHMWFSSDHQRANGNFYTSGWSDDRQQSAYNGRQNTYFGDNNYP